MGFGLEIELLAIPINDYDKESDSLDYQRCGLEDLKNAMNDEDIDATVVKLRLDGSFTKYPENYATWHLTLDNSMEPEHDLASK